MTPVIQSPVNNSITNNNKPVIKGTADANSTVTVVVDGKTIDTTTTDASGNWALTPSTALADGVHTVIVTSKNVINNAIMESITIRFTIDTTAPNAPTGPRLVDGKSSSLDNHPPNGWNC